MPVRRKYPYATSSQYIQPTPCHSHHCMLLPSRSASHPTTQPRFIGSCNHSWPLFTGLSVSNQFVWSSLQRGGAHNQKRSITRTPHFFSVAILPSCSPEGRHKISLIPQTILSNSALGSPPRLVELLMSIPPLQIIYYV